MKLEIIGVNSWVLKYTHTYIVCIHIIYIYTHSRYMCAVYVSACVNAHICLYVCVNISQLSPLEAMRPGSNEPV